jgi:hypothetical protein
LRTATMPSLWPTTSLQTAMVITAAAIMVIVFASFLVDPDAPSNLSASDSRLPSSWTPQTFERISCPRRGTHRRPQLVVPVVARPPHPRVSVQGDELTADSVVVASATR